MTIRDAMRFPCLLCLSFAATAADTVPTGAGLLAAWTASPTTHAHIPMISGAGRRAPDQMPNRRLLVTDYGATANDEMDDTSAMRAAIVAAEKLTLASSSERVAIILPPGKLILSDVLFVGAPRIWLVGAGSATTNIVVTKSLTDVIPIEALSGVGEEINFSWRGGMIWFAHDPLRTPPAVPAIPIVGDAKQGERVVRINPSWAASASALVGSVVHLRYLGDAAWRREVFGHDSAASIDWKKWAMLRADDTIRWEWATRIVSSDAHSITLRDPLRVSIKPSYNVVLGKRTGDMDDNALIGVSMTFPEHNTRDHLRNYGYNGPFFSMVSDALIRDVSLLNAENGIILERSNHCSVSVIHISGSPLHHGFSLREQCGDNVLHDFHFTAPIHHGLSVQDLSSGNVYTEGIIASGGIDSHCGMPFDNVFTDLTIAGNGSGGGAANGGPLVGRRQVMWNIRVTTPEVPRTATTPKAIKSQERENGRRLARLAALTGQQNSVMGAIIGIIGAEPQPEAKPWNMPPGDKGTVTGDWGRVPTPANLYRAQVAATPFVK